MDNILLRKINENDFEEWFSLVVCLWPDVLKDEMKTEFGQALTDNDQDIYLSIYGDKYVGFINLSTRREYVEGSESSPVGYIEGIYVKEDYREKGVASKLVDKAILFCKERGYKELGSDTELSNVLSQKFHESIGFKKAEIIVHYIKEL
ncbi:GNAT family N-acetyltransferase [Mycoplasmatota bacterium zrk1]